jgi:hypothetical protein
MGEAGILFSGFFPRPRCLVSSATYRQMFDSKENMRRRVLQNEQAYRQSRAHFSQGLGVA